MGYKEELARTRQLTADLGSGNRKQNFIADILDIGNKEFNPNDPSDLAKPMDKNLALLDDALFGGRFQKHRRDLYLDKRKPQLELQVKEKDLKDLSMVEVDQLLQAILTSYLGLEKKVDGD